MPVVPAPAPDEMPRMLILLVSLSKRTPGVKRATSSNDLMPLTSIVCWLSALMLIGTRDSGCSWRVAVTTISPASGAAADCSAPGDDACAKATAGAMAVSSSDSLNDDRATRMAALPPLLQA